MSHPPEISWQLRYFFTQPLLNVSYPHFVLGFFKGRQRSPNILNSIALTCFTNHDGVKHSSVTTGDTPHVYETYLAKAD